MTLEEYLTRYRLLQYGIEKDERSLILLSGKAYRKFLHCFSHTENPILQAAVSHEQALRLSTEKKKRLLERYATTLARAVSHVPPRLLREYALYHFLYGMTNEEIAEQSFFCVRTVYRYAKKAREALFVALKQVGPKVRRIPPCRYIPKTSLPHKRVLSREEREVAFQAALRCGEVYRNHILPVPFDKREMGEYTGKSRKTNAS